LVFNLRHRYLLMIRRSYAERARALVGCFPQ
jgi:hypothetical protein